MINHKKFITTNKIEKEISAVEQNHTNFYKMLLYNI